MQPLDEATQVALILRGYRETRMEFGLSRMKLGAHLSVIRRQRLWEGIAESWEAFLGSENINPQAARQYIAVADKFIYDLQLTDDTLRKLAGAGISALEKAARVINDDNKDDILASLISLSDRDAVQRIIEIASGIEDSKPEQASLRVLKMLREYYALPPDMQMDFRNRLPAKKTDFSTEIPSFRAEVGSPAKNDNDLFPGPVARGFAARRRR